MEKDNKLINVCKPLLCTGCGVCASVCPVDAISMNYNKIGALQSYIDNSLCIKCNKCRSVCPSIDSKKLYFREAIQSFYSKTQDKLIYSKSSSGGISTVLGKYVIEQGGVVYSAVFDSVKKKLEHRRIDNINQLMLAQGSMYIQSYIDKEIYKKIKIDVDNNKFVLCVGTPCQIAAIQKYLGFLSQKVFFVDLICHGVPGGKVFEKYIQMEVGNADVQKIIFRKKKNFSIEIIGNNMNVLNTIPLTPYTSVYYHAFMTGSIYRNSCHNCKYAKRERLSDITLGDTDYSLDGDVYSSVIIYSDKGLDIIKKISNVVVVEEKNEIMLNSHAQLNHSVPVCKEQIKFSKLCSKNGIEYALKHMNIHKTIIIYIRRFMYKKTKKLSIIYKMPIIKKILKYK